MIATCASDANAGRGVLTIQQLPKSVQLERVHGIGGVGELMGKLIVSFRGACGEQGERQFVLLLPHEAPGRADGRETLRPGRASERAEQKRSRSRGSKVNSPGALLLFVATAAAAAGAQKNVCPPAEIRFSSLVSSSLDSASNQLIAGSCALAFAHRNAQAACSPCHELARASPS